MGRIEPSHKEVMEYLDCCYYSCWHKGVCECKSPNQFKSCYEAAKAQLTKIILTDEEIKQGQEQNAKAMNAINEALSWLD